MDKSHLKIVTDKLQKFRDGREFGQYREAMPAPNSTAREYHGCMYLGMASASDLENRIRQHVFGTKSPRTSALKLNLWFPKTINIKLSLIILDQHNRDFIRPLEKALWDYYGPAIGKI